VSDLLEGLDAVVVATEWPEYKQIGADQVVAEMKRPLVVDPNRFLRATLGADPRVFYAAVGMPQ
jgi:UDPglucose 6-dehydrogenase